MQRHAIPVIFAVILFVISARLGITYMRLRVQLFSPTTYEECTRAPGSKIQESYPAICVAKSGAHFTQPITDEEKQTLVPPDETENWETYSNIRYRYSFKHPADIELIESNNALVGKKRQEQVFNFIYYDKNPTHIDPNSLHNTPTRIIDSHTAYITYCPTGCAEGTQDPSIQIDIYDGPRFQFTFSNTKTLDDIANQILSTFQFLPED